ncbi:MAG: GNAT family N-acetyltransferase [Acidimicrobiales bacterium]
MGASTTLLCNEAALRPDGSQVVLRPVGPFDESFLRQLHRSTRHDLAGIPGMSSLQLDDLLDFQFQAQRDSYAAEFPGAVHEVVLVDGVPAGRVYVDRTTTVHRLVDIALLPEHRARGIGTFLIRGLQATAAEDGARLRLHVRPGSAAVRLYRRLGFLPVPAGVESDSDSEPTIQVDLELEWRPEHWLPIHVLAHGGNPSVEWFDAGVAPLTLPFFVQEFHRAQHRNGNSPKRPWRRTGPLSELLDETDRAPGLAPSGFVFHMSRCGSTLLSQMLAADADHLVLSEPPAVDQVLRTWRNSSLGCEERQAALRAVLSVLGRPRHGERRLFVKFDAWHATMLPVLIHAFPQTPWVFLHRDPVEVLVSLERSTPAFMVAGGAPTGAFGFDLAEAVRMSPDEHAVAVVAAICRAARNNLDDRGMFVAYEDLPGALGEVLTHFKLDADPERVARMEAASMWNTKSPTLPFVADGPAKQAAASDEQRSGARLIAAALAGRDEIVVARGGR